MHAHRKPNSKIGLIRSNVWAEIKIGEKNGLSIFVQITCNNCAGRLNARNDWMQPK